MAKRMQPLFVMAAMLVGSGGCSTKLDEATARELLKGSPEFKQPTYCAWTAPRRHGSLLPPPDPGREESGLAALARGQIVPPKSAPVTRTPGVSDTGNFAFADTGKEAKCAAALDAAGLIKRGECVEPGCGGCCERALTAKGTAHIREGSADAARLEFVCGKLDVVRVTSITTENRRATVRYVSSVVFDTALLDRLDAEDCRVDRPIVHTDASQQERTRSGFVRDDSGKWSLQ